MSRTAERSLGPLGRALLVGLLLAGLVFARTDPFSVLFFLSYAGLGALLALRQPHNVIGWLLILIGYGFVGTTGPRDVDEVALLAGTVPWDEFLVVWMTSLAGYATFASLTLLLLVFPSGHLPAGRWRRPAIAVMASSVAVVVLGATAPTISFNADGGVASIMVPNRLAVLPELAVWSLVPIEALTLPTLVCLAIAVVSMLVRYRRAAGVEQLQLRWLVAAAAFVVVAITAGLSSLAVIGEDIGALAWIPAIVAYPTVPAAIYVAVTRYRLYEIDRIISRSIGWALTSGLVVVVFGLLIVGLQALVAPFTSESTLVVAVSTLVAAAIAQPVLRRIQAVVDRRFNRTRVDAEHTVADLGRRLRDETDGTRVRQEIESAVHRALAPSSTALWVRREPRR